MPINSLSESTAFPLVFKPLTKQKSSKHLKYIDQYLNQSLTTLFSLQADINNHPIKAKKAQQISELMDSLEEKSFPNVLKLYMQCQKNNKIDTLLDAFKQTITQIKQTITDLFSSQSMPELYLSDIDQLKTINLVPKYHVIDKERDIIYLSDDQLDNCRMVARKGILFFKDGITRANSFLFGNDGSFNYVMSDQAEIFAHPGTKHQFHHSSFLNGASVASAGEIKVMNGKIVHISNKSGHYKPEALHLLQALIKLHHLNVLAPSCQCEVHGFATFSARELLEEIANDGGTLPDNNEEILLMLQIIQEYP